MQKFGLTTFVLLLAPASAFGSIITLGSIATNNIAVLGYDSSFAGSTSIAVTNSSSHINVSGDVVSPNITGSSGLNFSSGSTVTSGAVLTNAESDLASVVSQLNALSYTSLTITSGTTNVISTPGYYTITGTLGAGTIIDLTGTGQYVFKTTGTTRLDLTNVTVNANAGLSSDNVFWYTTGNVDIKGGSIFGDVVLGSSSNPVLEAATGETPTGLTGRLLSEGYTTSIEAVQGATLNIDSFQAATSTPEPATFAFVFLGLGGIAALRRRR